MQSAPKSDVSAALPYVFTRNDPFDKSAAIELVVPRLLSSRQYMDSIRQFPVQVDCLAVWFLGQNGFLLKDHTGLLIGIDLYLTNSCATTFSHLPFRLDRQLPVFIEPEDLDIDVFVTTHAHDDHADPETIRRVPKKSGLVFVGPYDCMRVFDRNGVGDHARRLIHPGQTISLSPSIKLRATFALPTDSTDLNHTGMLIQFGNGTRFFDTGDTAYAERLSALLPEEVDICAICINGGFHNLIPAQAAAIVKAIRPRVVIPCHYDMMVNNVGSPETFRHALDEIGSDAVFKMLKYYEPWLYRRTAADAQ
jgi:L-ascorbate 6-phosphate lactonase